jgi:hypothetical protein
MRQSHISDFYSLNRQRIRHSDNIINGFAFRQPTLFEVMYQWRRNSVINHIRGHVKLVKSTLKH